jgi:putative ABC transport system substrate-binding protein
MRRRDFVAGVAGAAALPLVARAQQGERMRRVAVMMNAAPGDAQGQAYVAAIQQGMQERGWSVGRNVSIDLRWGGADREHWRRQVAEVLALTPDVIVAAGAILFEVKRASSTVPVIFSQAIDPVGAGMVMSMARPGGNATGFTQFDYNLAGKWVDLLREIAPGARRIGVLRDAVAPAGIGQWAIVQAAATTAGIEALPINPTDPGQIARGIAAFASEPNGGLIVTVGSSTGLHREAILAAAARHRLPAVYGSRNFAKTGGLLFYGPDLVGQYRRAAEYVDRILKGEKPADLPVQAPTRYELVVNLKTAKTLGLTVPPSLLARADEVIE